MEALDTGFNPKSREFRLKHRLLSISQGIVLCFFWAFLGFIFFLLISKLYVDNNGKRGTICRVLQHVHMFIKATNTILYVGLLANENRVINTSDKCIGIC